MPPPTVSVVVPVFDEEEALPAFHAELIASLGDWPVRSVEVVYVDDGSRDRSLELLQKLHLDDPDRVRVVSLRRNFGKSGALAAGFAASTGEVVVTLDADGQDVPGEVPVLLAAIADGAEVVGGWRQKRHDRASKRWQSKLYNATTRWLTGLDLQDLNTGMKAFTRQAVDELPLYGEFHRFVPVLAHDLGFRVTEVPVTHRERQAGVTKYRSIARFPKTLLDLLSVLFLTRFSERPLHLLGGTGLAFGAVGGVILVYLAGLKVFTGAGIGTRPLLQFGILLALVGVQLIGIGFLGDILRHARAREEQPYRVRRTWP